MIIICNHWLMFDRTDSEYHHGRDNNIGATNNPFPIKFIVLSVPQLFCSHTGPLSAVQTHSHSPAIIITCPMPSIHGAALLIYCSVCYMQTRILPVRPCVCVQLSSYSLFLSPHVLKNTHAHTGKTQSQNSSLKLTSAPFAHKRARPHAATHLTCQSPR